MAPCTKKHFVGKPGDNKRPPTQVPCYYNAGICVVDPIHEEGLNSFLRATYPYHHGPSHESSLAARQTLIPEVRVANFNV